jgi:CheY-like chemotaxis protein
MVIQGEIMTVLLVEDNDDHAELLQRSFEEHNVSSNIIRRASDGEQALHYLFGIGRYSDRIKYPVPNLILLDIRLPKVSGLEVLERIKSESCLKNIPVVMLTSSCSGGDVLKAYDNYVNSYVVKPVDFNKFSALIKDLGYYWFAWNIGPETNGCYDDGLNKKIEEHLNDKLGGVCVDED